MPLVTVDIPFAIDEETLARHRQGIGRLGWRFGAHAGDFELIESRGEVAHRRLLDLLLFADLLHLPLVLIVFREGHDIHCADRARFLVDRVGEDVDPFDLGTRIETEKIGFDPVGELGRDVGEEFAGPALVRLPEVDLVDPLAVRFADVSPILLVLTLRLLANDQVRQDLAGSVLEPDPLSAAVDRRGVVQGIFGEGGCLILDPVGHDLVLPEADE